ncbi:putative GAG protein [Labeo rohita]|uniref:Putative GAG protein n=1 Tax=Labeo rohita TaxID=84645 RepID=A0A498NLU8_LABRO|nr:putative GAG protein [Labeo rohita]
MSLSKSATPGSISSRACPAACGALIAAKDSHEFCVVCLGLKHAEQALADPEHCSHCLLLPKKLLRRRLKVAATQCLELGLSDSDGGHGDGDALPGTSQGATSLNWAELPNPAFPEEDIFSGNLPFVDEPAGSGDDDDAGLLGVSEDEEAIPLSGVAQVNPPAVVPQSILLEVCERAAARLNIEWPAPQSATDQERDVYDGKVLGPPPGPRKQLFPFLPACAKHMRHYWTDPLDFKHGLTGLEVKDMATLGMGDPPAVEPSIARHLNPAQGGLLAPPKPVLPSKMDRFSASVYQAAYKSSAVAVRALNVSSLLSAYQVENLDDLGQQLDKGSPSPTLWKEILMVNDLVLCNARQAVQASGRAMALSVVGERALWLNLSGLPDSEKRRIAGAPVEPGQALFGPAVAMMQQRFHPFMTGIHAHCGGLILGDVLSTASPGDRPLAYRASLWVYWATGELSISPIGGSRTRDDEREQ